MSQEHVPLSLQRRVRDRAGNRCEYCRLPQQGQEATFHIDHVRPRREGGPTTLANLALACVSCSLRKGARTTAPDPLTGLLVEVFDPREHRWEDHLQVSIDLLILGKTPIGRTMVELLRMNRSLAVEIRLELATRQRYP